MLIELVFRVNGKMEAFLTSPYVAFFTPAAIAISIAMFISFKKIEVGKNITKQKILWLSGITYYIYLLHTPIYRLAYKGVIENLTISVGLKIGILFIVTALCSIALAAPMKYICGKLTVVIHRILV